jgi:hypothetical protein
MFFKGIYIFIVIVWLIVLLFFILQITVVTMESGNLNWFNCLGLRDYWLFKLDWS